MKHANTAAGIALALCLGLVTSLVMAAPASPDAMKTRATVTEADARATALATLPGATVQSAELEIERRRLVWSFDLKGAELSASSPWKPVPARITGRAS